MTEVFGRAMKKRKRKTKNESKISKSGSCKNIRIYTKLRNLCINRNKAGIFEVSPPYFPHDISRRTYLMSIELYAIVNQSV